MIDIAKKKADRFLFLKHFYELAGGSTGPAATMFDIGKDLGFDRQKSQEIGQYLIEEGLLESYALGGYVQLTHQGIVEMEEALSNPEKPTIHFPSVNNYISIQNMSNSTIQQGSNGSTQNVQFSTNNLNELKEYLVQVRDSINLLSLIEESKLELMVELTTLESQISSPKPKPIIISESLKTIKTILEGAAGSVLATELISKLPNMF